MRQEMHRNTGENPRGYIVKHDSGSFWKSLQLPNRRRLKDIESSEKYKTGEESFPRERNGDQGDELSGNFVDDDELRIFDGCGVGDASGGRDADERDQRGKSQGCGSAQGLRKCIRNGGPEDYRDGGRPSSGAGMQAADAAKGGDE